MKAGPEERRAALAELAEARYHAVGLVAEIDESIRRLVEHDDLDVGQAWSDARRAETHVNLVRVLQDGLVESTRREARIA